MATVAGGARASGARLVVIVVLLALSVLLNYVDRGAIGVAAPLMKEELGLSAEQYGIAASAFFWAYAPMCLVVGWLCDRFCVYRIFAAGVAIWALSTAFTGFVHSLVALVVLRLLLGLGEAIAFPGSSKIFAAEVPAHYRGIANAALASALAFGPAVGTLAGGTILEVAGWRPIFWSFGLLTLLWLLPWRSASAPLRSASMVVPVVEPVAMGALLRRPQLWMMGGAHFLSNYGFYFLLTWTPLYLVKTLGYSIPQMTLVTTAGFLIQGISALTFGRLSDRWVAGGADEGRVRRNLMIAAQLFAGVGIAGLWFAQGLWQIGLCLAFAGISTGLIGTNIFAIGQIFAGPRGAGSWIGVQNALGNCSGIVGPIVTGIIVDQMGSYGLAFALAAGLSSFGPLWWWVLMPPVREVS